jgi:Skp family chaperone for outer membrane proteins
MKKIAVCVVLAIVSASCAIQAQTRDRNNPYNLPRAARKSAQRQQKASDRYSKQQQKAIKKQAKAQRKALKQTRKRGGYR